MSSLTSIIGTIDRVVIGVVCPMGLLGNMFTILMFCGYKSLRRSPAAIYLMALSISNSVFLVSLFFVWLDMIALSRIYNTYKIVCKVIVYTVNVSAGLSTAFVGVFTIERFLAVVHSMRQVGRQSITRSRIMIISLLFAFATLHSCSFVFMTTTQNPVYQMYRNDTGCGVKNDYINIVTYFHMFDLIVVLLVPLGLIILLNAMIANEMIRSWRRQENIRAHRQLSRHGTYSNRGNIVRQTTEKIEAKRNQAANITLFVISSSFVVLNLPYNILQLYDLIMNMLFHSYRIGKLMYVAKAISALMYYCNFAMNFFLYNVSSSKFRTYSIRAMTRLIPCVQERIQKKSIRLTELAMERQEHIPLNDTLNQNQCRMYGTNVDHDID